MHHADKAALHELKRENAALRAQNAALHAAKAKHQAQVEAAQLGVHVPGPVTVDYAAAFEAVNGEDLLAVDGKRPDDFRRATTKQITISMEEENSG